VSLELDTYYDIMVVGMSGMGKSTTSDKMVIAKPAQGHKVATKPAECQSHDKSASGAVEKPPDVGKPDVNASEVAKKTQTLQKIRNSQYTILLSGLSAAFLRIARKM
jgi:ABC-type dipeptide/oligopeptide/nickel transport system ATPase component